MLIRKFVNLVFSVFFHVFKGVQDLRKAREMPPDTPKSDEKNFNDINGLQSMSKMMSFEEPSRFSLFRIFKATIFMPGRIACQASE